MSGERTSLREIFLTCSKLGCISFGGPLAAVGIIQKEVVERRRWVDADWYAGALAITNLLPGPTATEMVIYVGYVRAGVAGGIVAGLCYIYPAFFAMLALSAVYFTWGLVPSVSGVVYGLTPAAVGVLIWAALQLARSAVQDAFHLSLLVAGFALVHYARLPVAWVILIGGALGALRLRRNGMLAGAPLFWLVSPTPAVDPTVAWDRMALLFWNMLKAGTLLFGGGYVIVPFLAQDFVDRLGWLTPAEFLAGFALGKATPGPLSITATFVGFKAGGVFGALVATVGIFLPGFVILLALAPFFERLRAEPAAQGFLGGLKAAAVGAILAATAELVVQGMPDWPSVGLLAASVAASFWVEATWIFLAAALLGLALGLAGMTA